jgi:hypothetical protein
MRPDHPHMSSQTYLTENFSSLVPGLRWGSGVMPRGVDEANDAAQEKPRGFHLSKGNKAHRYTF